MRFIDLFSGMGTVRMGFEQAGHTCVYSVEWDKHKRKIYEVIFGNEPEGKDITAVRGTDFPLADCWTFGAPCQDFSIAGARAGMSGERSSLVREVFRLVREIEEEHRPEWLLYENVKGMLSSNKGLDYLEILIEMESLGYDIEWQLLNSKNFGVPQNRERVYTLGHSRRFGSRKVFPVGESNGEVNELRGQPVISNTVTARTGAAQSNGTYVFEGERETQIKQLGNIMPNKNRDNPNTGRVYDTSGIAPTLCKMEGGNTQPFIIDDFYKGREPREYADVAPTLRADRQGLKVGIRETEDGFHLHRNDVKKSSIQGTHVTYPEGKAHCLSPAHVPMTIDNEVKCLNSKDENGKQPSQHARVYSTDGLMTALQAEQGGRFNIAVEPRACLTPNCAEKRQNGRRFKEPGEPMFTLTGQDIHGVAIYDMYNHRQRTDGNIGTLTSNGMTSTTHAGTFCVSTPTPSKEMLDLSQKTGTRIRRLTPRECMRLQGVSDDVTDKLIKAGISDSQMYRAAGDACTVNVIYEIARRL